MERQGFALDPVFVPGRPQEVYHRPLSRFVAHFIGETNFLEGTVAARDGVRVRVRTPHGEFWGTAGDEVGVAPGAAVALSLRPENLRLGTPPPGAANVLRGRAHDTIYLGEVVQQAVRLAPAAGAADGLELRVFELRPTVLCRDGRTEEVAVWFDPADAVVLTE